MVCLCFMKWDIMAVVDASDPQPSFSSIKWAWRTQKTWSHCVAPDNSLAAPHRPPSLNYCSGLVERNRRGRKERKEKRRAERESKRERDLLSCLSVCKEKNSTWPLKNEFVVGVTDWKKRNPKRWVWWRVNKSHFIIGEKYHLCTTNGINHYDSFQTGFLSPTFCR